MYMDTLGTRRRISSAATIRSKVKRRILSFSLLIGAGSTLLAAIVVIASAYPELQRWREINLRALSEIQCQGDSCDDTAYTTDWAIGGSDYIIATQTRHFLDVPDFR